MPASHSEIHRFLSEFKRAAQIFLPVIPRKKNWEFLTKHGLTARDREDAILGLQVRDYVKGPEADDRAGGAKTLWFFWIERDGLSIYVKLALVDERDEKTGEVIEHASCLGFHEAEWPMRYPFKRFER